MKRTFTFLSLLLMVLSIMAEPITPAAARQAAANFLQKQGIQLQNEVMRAPHRALGKDAAGIEASPYYVFNAEEGKGFVVVSGDDCIGDNLVLGYATNGSFDAKKVNDNMQWWLDEMGNQIAGLSQRSAKAKAAPVHENIDTLVTALWDQGSKYFNPVKPFNGYCPVVDGKLCVAGCMATALAQVMYYHQWPKEPTAEPIPAYTMWDGMYVDELPVTSFEWEDMVDNYKTETTEAQQKAVAKLMRYCGQSVQMEYAPSGSDGIFYDVDMLVKLFGYDQGLYSAHANDYTVQGWDALIYNELREGRPLVYCGLSSGGGHAFVVDGYQAKNGSGYYHVNWGWGGLDNGYFKIALLDSKAKGAGASISTDGYNRDQEALIGLQPAKGPLTNYGRYLTPANWNIPINDIPSVFRVCNTSWRPGTYSIYLAEENPDGSLDFHNFAFGNDVEFVGYDMAGMTSWRYLTYPEVDGLAPGTHNMILVNREAGTNAPWIPIFGPNDYIEVVVNDEGKVEDYILHPLPKLTTTATKINIDGIKQWGLKQDVRASITNNSDDDFIGGISGVIYKIDGSTLEKAIAEIPTGIMIEANGTTTISFPFSVNMSGRYLLELCLTNQVKKYEGIKNSELRNTPGFIGAKVFNIENLQFWCEELAYNDKDKDKQGNPIYKLDFKVVNLTGEMYDSTIDALIYRPTADGGREPVEFSKSLYRFIYLESGMYYADYISLPEPLEPGEYIVDLLMANDHHSTYDSDYFIFDRKFITVGDETGIENVNANVNENNAAIYNIAGQRLSKKQKGINIVNGRKVVY